MKKLIIGCCVVLLLGIGLAVGGRAAGGTLYSAYHDGQLHAIGDSLQGANDRFDRLHRRWWRGGKNSWHSGWSFDTDADDAQTPFVPSQATDTVRALSFSLAGGAVTIVRGADFALSGDLTAAQSELDGDTWEVELVAGANGATIALPEDADRFAEVELDIAGSAVQITDPLCCDAFDLELGAGTCDLALLDARTAELEVGAGRVSAGLADDPAAYRIEGEAGLGRIALNGASLLSGGGHYETHGAPHAARTLELTVGAGEIALTTEGESAHHGH